MRRLLTTVLVLAFAAAAGASHAQTVDISWDNCTPIVTTWDTSLPGGAKSFYASVVGQTTPHQAYQVWWLAGDANAQLPDAWRFDAAGCNGGLIDYKDQPPTILLKTCPPFVPAATQKVQIAAFQLSPAGLGYPTTAGNGSLSVSYPAGVLAPNPATRYHLATFTHDFTFASNGPTPPGNPPPSCGGFETPMCVNLIRHRVSYLDTSNIEFPFLIGNATLTVNSIGGCPAVPAKASTWGTIKGQYRR